MFPLFQTSIAGGEKIKKNILCVTLFIRFNGIIAKKVIPNMYIVSWNVIVREACYGLNPNPTEANQKALSDLNCLRNKVWKATTTFLPNLPPKQKTESTDESGKMKWENTKSPAEQ